MSSSSTFPDFLLESATSYVSSARKDITFTSHQLVVSSSVVGERLPSACLQKPEDIHAYYEQHIRPTMQDEKEHVHLLILDAHFSIKAWTLISMGSLTESYANPREVFRPAIVAAAHRIVLIHNHPSGDPSPSSADESLTRKLEQAGAILGIQLIEHLIVGTPAPGRLPYWSFREAGLLR
jgi:DNA repair protein RadC